MTNLTPLKAVRTYCVECSGDSPREVRLCPAERCALHPIRSGNNVGRVESVVKQIRKRCLDCSGGSREAVSGCELKDCPLHPFRMGRNPNRKGVGGHQRG